MSSVDNRYGQALIEIARRALTSAVKRREVSENFPDYPDFQGPGGVFVTLRKGKHLRGCIGQFRSTEPLPELTAHCAMAAALEDPRFSPVGPDELSEITIELSVLSPVYEITPPEIIPGKHGVLVSSGYHRGVLLPQVAAENHWTAERFLEETCVKAGLERDAWKHLGVRLEAFTADIFTESRPQLHSAREAQS